MALDKIHFKEIFFAECLEVALGKISFKKIKKIYRVPEGGAGQNTF
jgi:hypothetical protein